MKYRFLLDKNSPTVKQYYTIFLHFIKLLIIYSNLLRTESSFLKHHSTLKYKSKRKESMIISLLNIIPRYSMSRYLYYFPIVFIVLSNILYDISAKSFPKLINAQAGMLIYYMIAAAISLVLFFLTSKNKNFFEELKKINWATFSLALGCTGLDFGYVLAFRAGWDISFASLVCNILIAVSLILVGVLFYHEIINKIHVTGILLCFIGFVLITHAYF